MIRSARRAPSCPTPRRFRGDRGTALTESAFVAPVVLLLIFGILEFGPLFRDYLTLGDAVADGARIGSALGPDTAKIDPTNPASATATADYFIVRAALQSTSSLNVDDLDRIVIFDAGPPSSGAPLDQVPRACKTSTANGVISGRREGSCNIYNPKIALNQLALPNGYRYFDCSQTPGSPACYWNPVTRKNGPTIGDIEYLGVYIKAKVPLMTGIFGDEFTVEQAAIVRLEPGGIR